MWRGSGTVCVMVDGLELPDTAVQAPSAAHVAITSAANKNETDLLTAEVPDRRNQGGTASRLVPFVSDRDTVDDVVRVALGNDANGMSRDRTTAHVAHAGHRDAVNREMLRTHAHDLAAV